MPFLEPLSPIADQPLSVVLLAHNEAPHLEAVVNDWLTLLAELGRDHEVLLVDAGSTDGTLELAESLATRVGGLQVLRSAGRGHGAALRTALVLARKPLLFYTTCDRQYQAAELMLLLAEIDKVHLISGFRRWRPIPVWLRWPGRVYRLALRILLGFAPEPLRLWLGWREYLFRMAIRIFFAVRLQDVNCVFRLCRRDIFAHIPIQSEGDFVHAEVLAKANFLGCYMSDDIAVTYQPRTEDDDQAQRRQRWKDGYRVLSHPDFGACTAPVAQAEIPQD
jgi:glycosyltransferase involved in cell wall biosynthesis